MSLMRAIFFCMAILVAATFVTSCDKHTVQESVSGADQVMSMFKVPKNSEGHTVEQQNVLDRYKVTTDFAKVLWIHLISLDGKIVKRMAVRSKVTSSQKRLEPSHAADGQGYFPDHPYIKDINRTDDAYFETDEFISPDGTFGSSDDYVYWFDPMGRYHQWGTAGGLGYLLTDYPIDLEDPIDKITGLYKVEKAAAEWQALQEEQLRAAQ